MTHAFEHGALAPERCRCVGLRPSRNLKCELLARLSISAGDDDAEGAGSHHADYVIQLIDFLEPLVLLVHLIVVIALFAINRSKFDLPDVLDVELVPHEALYPVRRVHDDLVCRQHRCVVAPLLCLSIVLILERRPI